MYPAHHYINPTFVTKHVSAGGKMVWEDIIATLSAPLFIELLDGAWSEFIDRFHDIGDDGTPLGTLGC
jgi:hypothetical protein